MNCGLRIVDCGLPARVGLSVAAVIVVPAGGPELLAQQFPTEPPPAMELRPLMFPPFQEAKLKNGLTLVVVENRRLPIVSVSLNLQAGSRQDADGLEGLAAMAAELLTKGTERRTAEQIAAEIEGVGASLNVGAGDDFFSVSTTVLTDHIELAFELISDILLNSTFPESELELARTRALSALQLEKSSPGALASRFFMEQLYGQHPYGRHESEASLKAMTRETVRQYAATHLRPGSGLLVLAGDISLKDARRLAERFLGSWRGDPPTASYPEPPAPQPTSILLVHRPGATQSNIRTGNLALRPRDDTYYAAVVANKILGGGTDARLFMLLREQRGWTYGAYSSVSRRRDLGYFQARTEVRNPVTDSALVELLHQLRRVRTELVADSELIAAKGYLVGSFPLSIETPQQIAGQVANVKLLGLAEDYLRTYRERLAAVTAEQAREAARAVITPDSLVIVVVGDGQVVYDKLSPVAPVRIVDVEGAPLTPDDLTPKATAVAFEAAQLTPRRDSFQITVQGNPFGTLVSEYERRGDTVVYRERVSMPMAGVQGESTVRFRAADLAILSVEQTGQMGGQPVATSLTYDGTRATGRVQSPRRTEEIDTTLAEGTVDGEAVQPLVPALPLAEGAAFTLNAFDASEGTVTPATVKVRGVEEVTVPAGTFAAFRVELSRGQQALAIYVSRDTPRRIVKMEPLGQRVAFELVAMEGGERR